MKIFYRALDANSQAYADASLEDLFVDQSFPKIVEQLDMTAKLDHVWRPKNKLPTKCLGTTGVSLEQAKINEKFMWILAQCNANMEMLIM